MAGKAPEDIRLSPLSRLYFTLDCELEADKGLVNDAGRYDRLVKMLQVAEAKRDALMRNVIVLDAISFLLIFGKGFTLPGVGIPLSEVPAAREIVALLASFAFQFATLAYLNWHGYAAYIDMINKHRAAAMGVDPDWLSAIDKFQEFAVKVYRAKMNIHGIDFVVPRRPYRVVSLIITALLLGSVISFLCIHMMVIAVSARETLAANPTGVLVWMYVPFLVSANIGGLLVLLSLNRSFNFFIPEVLYPRGDQSTQAALPVDEASGSRGLPAGPTSISKS